MTTKKHSPGPWRTDEDEHDAPHQNIQILDAEGRKIAEVWIDDACFDGNPRQEANAHLMVRAPELLEENERLKAENKRLRFRLDQALEKNEACDREHRKSYT